MNLFNAISIGFKEIWAHKFRSLLTMLGIILGVSSLVAMSALVSGMEKGAKEALIAIGGLGKVRIEPQEIPLDQRQLTDEATGMTINAGTGAISWIPTASQLGRQRVTLTVTSS